MPIVAFLLKVMMMPIIPSPDPDSARHRWFVLVWFTAAAAASAALTAMLAEADRFGRAEPASWASCALVALAMSQAYGVAAWSAWARTMVVPRVIVAAGFVALYGRVLGRLAGTAGFGGRFLFISTAWVFLLTWFFRRHRDTGLSLRTLGRLRFQLQDVLFTMGATGLLISTLQSVFGT